jgi:hypothetical protein
MTQRSSGRGHCPIATQSTDLVRSLHLFRDP